MTQTWISTRLIAGHGVASGRSADSPYPNGTIEMQRPLFKALGLDLFRMLAGHPQPECCTTGLRLRDPDRCFPLVAWTDRHPPETFSFWRIHARQLLMGIVDGWIYQPHPETKSNITSHRRWWRCWHHRWMALRQVADSIHDPQPIG